MVQDPIGGRGGMVNSAGVKHKVEERLEVNDDRAVVEYLLHDLFLRRLAVASPDVLVAFDLFI